MTFKPIIFTNEDVYQSISQKLKDSVDTSVVETENWIDNWFTSPPSYTTIRVNSLKSSVKKVEDFITKSLSVEAVRKGLPVPEVSKHPQVPDLLVLHPWKVDTSQLKSHEREVIVDATCGDAVLRGANVYAPGVKGMPSDTKEGDLVSVHADTAGRCTRGLSVKFTDPGKIFVGNGVMQMSRSQLFGKDNYPKGLAVSMTEPATTVPSVTLRPALGLLQNLPSVVTGHVVGPKPGDKVIDLCAAPGHKTTHLAALMKNEGIVVALDKSSRKAKTLKLFCESMGAKCVKTFAFDSTEVVSQNADESWTPPFLPNTFDHVLLDAPCSALGQRPRFGNKLTIKQISSHPVYQRKLFEQAIQLAKPGGSIVYSTCSLTLEENEDIIFWALGTFPYLDLVPASPLIGKSGSPQSSLSKTHRDMVQRFGPPIGLKPEEDTVGYFIAKFIKNALQ